MLFTRRIALFMLVLAVAVQYGFAVRPRKVPRFDLPTVAPEPIYLGGLALPRCPGGHAYCGTLVRPLDPAGQVAGSINIAFEFYPHTDSSQQPLEPIVAVEGGPGYPSTGSRYSYLTLFGPLRDRHDLLLVDNRGTGKSQPLDCELIQRSNYLFLVGIADCANELGMTSDLYGSALAADDLAAVLDALGFNQIDLYGDSYGTFFSQTFAGLHPERLRAVILDSAYPVIGGSPWYPEAAPAMRNAFASVCQQSVTCRGIPGDSVSRITALLQSLRRHPFSGRAYDGNGTLRAVSADPTSLALLAFGNATGPVVYRELDAAARAYLDQGNADPLLRLFAEDQVVGQSGGPPFATSQYSAGLFVAVSCSDYPYVYDLRSPLSERPAQRTAAFARQRAVTPGVYSPFSIAEFNSTPLDYSVLDTCLSWPVPSRFHPPAQPVPPGTVFTSAPVLVLSGTLDSLTPAGQGREVANLFVDATQILVANSFHVTAAGDLDNCASVIVRNFVATLNPGDTTCASQVAEVRTIPRFARAAAQLDPATPLSGNQATDADLRVAYAAALTAGDAIARWWMNETGSGVGLYGGTFEDIVDGGGYQFKLNEYRWVKDVSISGVMTWQYSTPGTVQAHVHVSGTGTAGGELNITWNDRERYARATITGTLGGRIVEATTYAP